MGDYIEDRTERDRSLFDRTVKDQLHDLVKASDPGKITGAIVRAIEMQVVTEEISRDRGIEIDRDEFVRYIGAHREFVSEQVDRAITKFIGSIYSQEG